MSKDNINLNNLEQSKKLIQELNLSDQDIDMLSNKMKKLFDKPEVLEKYKAIKELKIEEGLDLGTILTKIIENVSKDDLVKILKIIIGHENLLDDIQDLFLDKLL